MTLRGGVGFNVMTTFCNVILLWHTGTLKIIMHWGNKGTSITFISSANLKGKEWRYSTSKGIKTCSNEKSRGEQKQWFVWNMKSKYYKPPFLEKRRESMTHPFFRRLRGLPLWTWIKAIQTSKEELNIKEGNKREWNKLRMILFFNSCKSNPLRKPSEVE